MKLINQSLVGFKIRSLDEVVGKACDFYFDYATWKLSHLSVKIRTGTFSSCRLLPVERICEIDLDKKEIGIKLLSHQIINGPKVHPYQPITSSFYREYWQEHYAVPNRPEPIEFAGPFNPILFEVRSRLASSERYYPLSNLNTLSIRAIDGLVSGGILGEIIDFQNFCVEAIIFKTSLWPWGKKKLIETRWIRSIDWQEQTLHVELPAEICLDQLDFDPGDENPFEADVSITYSGKLKFRRTHPTHSEPNLHEPGHRLKGL